MTCDGSDIYGPTDRQKCYQHQSTLLACVLGHQNFQEYRNIYEICPAQCVLCVYSEFLLPLATTLNIYINIYKARAEKSTLENLFDHKLAHSVHRIYLQIIPIYRQQNGFALEFTSPCDTHQSDIFIRFTFFGVCCRLRSLAFFFLLLCCSIFFKYNTLEIFFGVNNKYKMLCKIL